MFFTELKSAQRASLAKCRAAAARTYWDNSGAHAEGDRDKVAVAFPHGGLVGTAAGGLLPLNGSIASRLAARNTRPNLYPRPPNGVTR
jgi:hypothetical protein